MENRSDFTFLSADGAHQIHAVLWEPAGTPRAVVQIVHGLCEYISRYEPFARYLVSQGFAVAGNDHLGHGLSVNTLEEYGFFTDWDHLVRDVYTLHFTLGRRFPGVPRFLLGHSMGSFVARTFLIDYPGAVDGCILSGTGQEAAPMVAAGRLLTGMGDPHKANQLFQYLSLGAYNRKFSPNRTSLDWLSRDETMVNESLNDFLCKFQPTAAMNHAMMKGLQYVSNRRNLAKMDRNTPVYFFSGDQDPVGDMGKGVWKVAGFFHDAGTKDVAVRLYPGGRHEMLRETNREQVFRDTAQWLAAHIPTQA